MDEWDMSDEWDSPDNSMALARLGSLADTLTWLKKQPAQSGPLVFDFDGLAKELHAILTGPKAAAVIAKAARRATEMANSMAQPHDPDETIIYGATVYNNGDEPPGAAVYTDNVEAVVDEHLNGTLLKILAAIGPTKGT